MSSATILGVTGIAVSGVVGPLVGGWMNRRGDRQRFDRDQQQRRREDLQAVVDEAANLLGAGETNLRLAHEAAQSGAGSPPGVAEWAKNVHLLGQRLLLRLPADDPVVTKYEAVRTALLGVGKTYGDDARYPQARGVFEMTRSDFLDEARSALERTTTG